jgi:hypothetical protein
MQDMRLTKQFVAVDRPTTNAELANTFRYVWSKLPQRSLNAPTSCGPVAKIIEKCGTNIPEFYSSHGNSLRGLDRVKGISDGSILLIEKIMAMGAEEVIRAAREARVQFEVLKESGPSERIPQRVRSGGKNEPEA